MKNYAHMQLANWANNKFDMKITAQDLLGKPPKAAADTFS